MFGRIAQPEKGVLIGLRTWTPINAGCPKSTGSTERTTLYQSSDSGQHRTRLLVRIYAIIFV